MTVAVGVWTFLATGQTHMDQDPEAVTESCDTVISEINGEGSLSGARLVDLDDIESELRCMRHRIVMRQFLRRWLQTHRQQASGTR